MSKKILDGVRVIDVSSYVTGGFASMMLANLGAEVVKIERPGGEPTRETGPPFIEGVSPYFTTVNYGKKSVVLDLTEKQGREILYEIVEETDVFLQNFKRSTTERLNLTYEDLLKYNDELIYCSISAFGDDGPWSDRRGFDLIMQALTGIMDVTGEEDGEPVKVGVPMTDTITGMWAAFGIVSALFQRQMTGESEYIDLAMYDGVLPWLTKQAGNVLAGEETRRMGTRDPVIAPYQAMEAKDGHLIIAMANQNLWEVFCEVIDRPDLVEDERFASNAARVENVDEMQAEIEKELKKSPIDEWMELLVEEHGLAVAPIQSVEEALTSEQTEARCLVKELEHATLGEFDVIEHPLNFRNSRSSFDSHAPVLGQHTREVLTSMGYDPSEIAELEVDGVVASNDAD